jgi:hypothetical protein
MGFIFLLLFGLLTLSWNLCFATRHRDRFQKKLQHIFDLIILISIVERRTFSFNKYSLTCLISPTKQTGFPTFFGNIEAFTLGMLLILEVVDSTEFLLIFLSMFLYLQIWTTWMMDVSRQNWTRSRESHAHRATNNILQGFIGFMECHDCHRCCISII